MREKKQREREKERERERELMLGSSLGSPFSVGGSESVQSILYNLMGIRVVAGGCRGWIGGTVQVVSVCSRNGMSGMLAGAWVGEKAEREGVVAGDLACLQRACAMI